MMNATTSGSRVAVHGQVSDVTGPDAGRTASVVPRTAVTTTGAPVGIERVVLGEGEPGLAGQPDVARMELVADLVETERALADEPAVDARRQRRLTLALSRLARKGRPTTTPSIATAMATTAWNQTALSGNEEGEQAGREGADGEEDREERRARQLEHEQRQRGDEPDGVDRHGRSLCRSCHGVVTVRQPRSRIGLTSVARRVIDSSSWGDGKPAMRWR